jgi:hypothetical protein
MPILFIDTFNDKGLIVDEIAYYSENSWRNNYCQ